MEETTFLCELTFSHVGDLEQLFSRCESYIDLSEGHGYIRGSGESLFNQGPDDHPKSQIHVIGLYSNGLNNTNRLIGILHLIRGYPSSDTWWIGLLLIDPEFQSRGWGHAILEWLDKSAIGSNVSEIQLGVFQENYNAIRFWDREGYELSHITDPISFGFKRHSVQIMRKNLVPQDVVDAPSVDRQH